MSISSGLHQFLDRLKQIPKKYYVFGFIGIIGLLIGVFFVPKTVTFSYAERTCTRELTVFPGIHRQAGTSDYEVAFEDQIKLAGVAVLSGSVCFTPLQTPEQGDAKITTSVLGSWILHQVYTLKVGDEPRVDVAAFEQPVPTTKPISVTLDQPDSLHEYQLVVDEKTTECIDKRLTLSCDIEQLELDQGKKYNYKLTRQFSEDDAESINHGVIETLRATKVTEGSVKNGQTVYSKPTSFSFKLDKPVASAQATLVAGKAEVETKVSHSKNTVSIKLAKQLKRDQKYSLTLDQVEAEDGSTLVDPYKVAFTVSGGPKVTGISIGSSRVDPNAQAVITFDQDLSDKQNVASLVSFKGGKATASKIGARQIAVQLNGLDRCVPFTISVAGGMLSKYDIKNSAGWSHSGRTICYTTNVYGTSLQGRPLVSYHFGNSGPVTLYTGAIHGNEISSKYMMESWISELEANPGKIGNRQVVVIPSINPDGVAAGTRNNSRDVNLSRNFPTDNWVKDIDDTDGHNKGGGGKKPLSEPAAAALARFTQNLRPRLLLSYHAIGSLVVGDGHGTYSGGKAAQYASMVGYRNATGESGTFDYSITGAYEDWTWRNIGIPSMVIELGSYGFHDFGWHRDAMWAMLD